MDNSKKLKKLLLNVGLIIVLVIGFVFTTYALMKDLLLIDDNLFKTGKIKINLNDGKSIIDDDDFLFEPGMTVEKDFFVENQGTFDVYYKVYFEDVSGDLADILDVTIKNGEDILYQGTIKDLNRKKVKTVDDVLEVDEKVVLSVLIHYPVDSKNDTQDKSVFFRLGVDAVQTKNNSSRVFD